MTAAIARVGVVGAGLMGSGIAQVSAVAGLETILVDPAPGALERALQGIRSSLEKAVEKGGMSAAGRDDTLARIHTDRAVDTAAPADLVIEAVTEDLQVKREVFALLDRAAPAETVFASNTSSLSITQLAVASGRPDRMVGLHFFNPVPRMALVEVVSTLLVRRDVVERAVAFARGIGKEPVRTSDRAGFIVNRLLIPYMMDAVRALEQGAASIPDLDRAMHLGAGHPMGPLTLLDLVGLDTAARAADQLYREYLEPRFAAPPLLRRLVAAGHYGRKTGRGFYVYGGGDPVPVELDR